MMMEMMPPLIIANSEWVWLYPRKCSTILTISSINVAQYAHGLSVHNPQARMNNRMPTTRGTHPTRIPDSGLWMMLPKKEKKPPMISTMACMNKRMAMIVMPSGRLSVVMFCMKSSLCESLRSKMDMKQRMSGRIACYEECSSPRFLWHSSKDILNDKSL